MMERINFFKKYLGAYYPMAAINFFMAVIMSLFRIFHMACNYERITSNHDLISILLNGLRTDVVTICYISAVPVVLTLFFEGLRFTHRIFSSFLIIWFSFWTGAVVFMEAATPSFINQYDVRPNRLFVEYLIYPKEVLGMLFKDYLPQLIIGNILVIILVCFSFKLGKKLFSGKSESSFIKKAAVFPLAAVLIFAGARSSLKHRPFSPANVSFSTDSLLNDLSLNSLYSMLYAVYRMKDEGNPEALYGKMDQNKIFKIISKLNFNDKMVRVPAKEPLRKYLKAADHGNKYNIVIILEESLGAEFVGKLGGKNLTPELDRLSHKGWWFENLYATGTRSVRGIEALISGFPPTPGRSVVKLGKSQNNFFTIADFLSKKGYLTSFIYGGDSSFDNMRRFFLGNGFKKIIDQKDFRNPVFESTWGVSDTDLFNKAHEFFSSQKDRPFFSLVFTSSNHSPFEVPEMDDNFYPDQGKSVNNAVKFADYALGDFFKKAEKSSYWKNTVFLVVADHNSRVYGNEVLPVERFRIPGLIIGPGIKPKIIKTVASQIDLPLTVLSLAGISGYVPMPGKNIAETDKNYKGRAILQFYKKNGYMTDGNILIMQPWKKADQYVYSGKSLLKSDLDKNMQKKALAQSLWTFIVYDKKLYR